MSVQRVGFIQWIITTIMILIAITNPAPLTIGVAICAVIYDVVMYNRNR